VGGLAIIGLIWWWASPNVPEQKAANGQAMAIAEGANQNAEVWNDLPVTEPAVHPGADLDLKKPVFLTRSMWLCQDDTRSDRSRSTAQSNYASHRRLRERMLYSRSAVST
jgi:hypothetical protein